MPRQPKPLQQVIDETLEQAPGTRLGYVIKKLDPIDPLKDPKFGIDALTGPVQNMDEVLNLDPSFLLELKIYFSLWIANKIKPLQLEGLSVAKVKSIVDAFVGISVFKVYMADTSEIIYCISASDIATRIDQFISFRLKGGVIREVFDYVNNYLAEDLQEELQSFQKVAVNLSKDGQPVITDFMGFERLGVSDESLNPQASAGSR